MPASKPAPTTDSRAATTPPATPARLSATGAWRWPSIRTSAPRKQIKFANSSPSWEPWPEVLVSVSPATLSLLPWPSANNHIEWLNVRPSRSMQLECPVQFAVPSGLRYHDTARSMALPANPRNDALSPGYLTAEDSARIGLPWAMANRCLINPIYAEGWGGRGLSAGRE
jgi:hypothetical protein